MLELAFFADPGKRAMFKAMRHLGLGAALFSARRLPAGIDAHVVTCTAKRHLNMPRPGRWSDPEVPHVGETW